MWFGVYRWFYNEAKRFSEEHKIYSFDELRNSMRVDSKFQVPKKWDTKLIPPRIITGAIHDYCSAFNSSMALYRNGHIKHFEIKEKRKKERTQTLALEQSCFCKNNVLFARLEISESVKGLKLNGYYKYKCKRSKKKRKLNIKDIPIDSDCRISYNNSKFYLLIPCSKERLEKIKNGDDDGLKKTKKIKHKTVENKFCVAEFRSGKRKGEICGVKVSAESKTEKYCGIHISREKEEKFCEAELISGKRKGEICGIKISAESKTKKYCKKHLSKEKEDDVTNVAVAGTPQPENGETQQKQKYCVISIDSGVRTFQTGYCPEGHSVEIGQKTFEKLSQKYWKLDKLNSKYFGN